MITEECLQNQTREDLQSALKIMEDLHDNSAFFINALATYIRKELQRRETKAAGDKV